MSFRELSGVVAVCDALCGAEGPVADTFAEAERQALDVGFVKHGGGVIRQSGGSMPSWLLCSACNAEAVGMPASDYVRIAWGARARKEGAV